MRITVSSNGRIVLPAKLRKQDAIRTGQQFEVERVQAGHYVLKKLSIIAPSRLVEWLRSCPEQNWFTPIESELTDEF